MVENRPYQIGIALIEGFALMSYAAVTEPFRAANLLAGRRLYDLINIPAAGEVARSSGGAMIEATGKIGGSARYDLMLLVAGGDPTRFHDERLFNWLRRLDREGVTLGGVSGGPVILATAGLMEGRRMTVHWEHAPALAEISPTLMIEQRLYIIDRDRVTCAGGAAPMDMIHALIADHHGPDFARRVSDWFLHTDIRPAGGPQRAGVAERAGVSNRVALDAIVAMESHVADPLTLSDLAGFSMVSPRHLNRVFQDSFGMTTMAYYRNLRLDVARRLLTATPMSLTEIALATGFASSAHFSRCFAVNYGVSPSKARKGAIFA
ncbi:MAG: GlxA family transcriptional regulator [Pikeienuella sp.]